MSALLFYKGGKKRCKCSHGMGVVETTASPCPTDGKDKCASCNHMYTKKGDTCTPCTDSQKAAKHPPGCDPAQSSSSDYTIQECNGTTPNCKCSDEKLMKVGENCVSKSDKCKGTDETHCSAPCMADLLKDKSPVYCKSDDMSRTMEIIAVNSDAKKYKDLCADDKVLVKRSNTGKPILEAEAKQLNNSNELLYTQDELQTHDFVCRKQCNCGPAKGGPDAHFNGWTSATTQDYIGTSCKADYMSKDAKDNPTSWLSLDCPVGTGLNFRLADRAACDKRSQYYDELNNKCVKISQGPPCRAPWEEVDKDAAKKNAGKPKKTTQGFNLSTIADKSCKPKDTTIWCGVDNANSKGKTKNVYTLQLGTGDHRCFTAQDIKDKDTYGSGDDKSVIIASGCRDNEYTGGSNTKFDNKGLHGDPGCPLPTSPQNWRLDTGEVVMLDNNDETKEGCPKALYKKDAKDSYFRSQKCPQFASTQCHVLKDDDGILKCTYKPVTIG